MKKIHIAAQDGNIEDLKKELGLVDVNTPDEDGYTALHWASQNGHIEVVKLLIASGSNSSLVDKDGFFALEIACNNGHTQVVKFLLENGADPNQGRDGFTALHSASGYCHSEIISMLIAHGANVNANDNTYGGEEVWIPLHWAAQENCLDVAKILIENGADINALTNPNGLSPLDIAIMENNIAFAKLLLENGADVGTGPSSENYLTPAHLAASYNRPEIMELLIQYGVNVFAKDDDGMVALDNAIDVGAKQIVKMLEKAMNTH